MRTHTMGFLTLNLPPAGNAPPLDTVIAAATAGFKSVGLRITGRRPEDEYPRVLGRSEAIRAIRRRLNDEGLRLSSTIGYGFFPDVEMADHARVLEATAELGAELVMLNVYLDDHKSVADSLAEFCSLAIPYNVRVGIEFIPFSQIKTIEDADKVITMSGAPNAGIVVDALHLARSGGVPSDLAKIDQARIYIGQICDGMKLVTPPSDDELRAEARAHRLYPGEGEFPLREMLDALPSEIEIEFEVPRSDQVNLSLEQRARKAAQVFADFMNEYDARKSPVLAA
jgi:sugar phosphate isomerase/epimerase